MMIHIREGKQSDLAELTRLTTQLGYQTSLEQLNGRLHALLESENDILFVAENKKTVVGWITAQISYRLSSDPFLEISGLIVDEAARGKGVGRKLIQHVETWARQKKHLSLRVRCNVVRQDTHQFYKHLGFADTKSQKVFKKSVT